MFEREWVGWGGEGIKAENNGTARLCGHKMCSAMSG